MVIFILAGVLAILAGGMVMAFSARDLSQIKAWASAYLVLVVGLAQLGLVMAWQHIGGPERSLALVAFAIYNLGNICVLLGTIYKSKLQNYSWVVNAGGMLLALAMILLFIVIRHSLMSWALAGFVVLVGIILVSMPIGLLLSGRRKPTSQNRPTHN